MIGTSKISDINFVPRVNTFDIEVTDSNGVTRPYEGRKVVVNISPVVLQRRPLWNWMKSIDNTRWYDRNGFQDSSFSSWNVWPHGAAESYLRLWSSQTRTYVSKVPISISETGYGELQVAYEQGCEVEVVVELPNGNNHYSQRFTGNGQGILRFIVPRECQRIWVWSYGVRFGIYDITIHSFTQKNTDSPGGILRDRPATSHIGHTYFCTDLNEYQVFDGNEWKVIKNFN